MNTSLLPELQVLLAVLTQNVMQIIAGYRTVDIIRLAKDYVRIFKTLKLNWEEKTTLFGSQYWILQHNYQCFIIELKAFILVFWSFYINKGFITSWENKLFVQLLCHGKAICELMKKMLCINKKKNNNKNDVMNKTYLTLSATSVSSYFYISGHLFRSNET